MLIRNCYDCPMASGNFQQGYVCGLNKRSLGFRGEDDYPMARISRSLDQMRPWKKLKTPYWCEGGKMIDDTILIELVDKYMEELNIAPFLSSRDAVECLIDSHRKLRNREIEKNEILRNMGKVRKWIFDKLFPALR